MLAGSASSGCAIGTAAAAAELQITLFKARRGWGKAAAPGRATAAGRDGMRDAVHRNGCAREGSTPPRPRLILALCCIILKFTILLLTIEIATDG